jgi:Spy/CpxP family protein refolding chaperone
MSDPTTAQASPDPSAPGESRWRRFRRSGWTLVGVAALTGLIGFGAGRVSGARWHGYAFGMHQQFAGEATMRRAEWGIDRMLSRVDGTAEQKAKISEIARAAIRDLQPMREQFRGGRDRLATALRAEKVDRAAIEQLRGDQLALGEMASKRVSQAISDAAEVLTPGQRATLVERWQRRSWRG